MNRKDNKERYVSLIHDIAESVSFNEESADLFFEEEGIDIESYVSKGLVQMEEHVEKNKVNKITPKNKSSSKGQLYFKRAVLAAEIASQLYKEPTFGHVKFQKLVYLGEQICELKADKYYTKQVAGPYDNRFMHSIDNQFKRQKWFDVKIERKGKFSKYDYNPLKDLENYKKYYNQYYSNFDKDIQWLIGTFRKKKTSNVELIATLYFCWKEIIQSQEMFSEELLIQKFYKWSAEKAKFSQENVKGGIKWMREYKLVPIL